MRHPAFVRSICAGQAALVAMAIASCAGEIEEGSSIAPAAAGSGAAAMSSGGRNAGARGVAPAPEPGGAPDMAGATVPAPGACGGPVVAPSRMRRLTNGEYTRAVRDTLGLPEASGGPFELPGESTVNNFENASGLQSVSEQHVSAFANLADRLVQIVFADGARRSAFIACDPASPSCLRSFLERTGRRAYRRPLTADELGALAAWTQRLSPSIDPPQRFATATRALFASPRFLFVWEPAGAVPGSVDLHRLDSYALATRIALVAWGTVPDDRLLDAARDGQLDAPGGLDRIMDMVLADPRSRAGQRTFAYRWLRLRDVTEADRDPREYLGWTEALRSAMIEETARFVEELAWRPGADLRELFTTKATFVNGPLARLYGLAAPSSSTTTFGRVELPPASQRYGLVTQASFLTASGRLAKAPSILRGKLIQEALLCRHIPEPPDDVPPLEATRVAPGTSDRRRLDQHRTSPACAGCHQFLDPVGHGLDGYDGIGRLRALDSAGQPIDTRGTIAGSSPGSYDGPAELSQLLRSAPETASCLARQLFRWAMGRTEEEQDRCALAQIDGAFAAGGYTYPSLIRAIVKAEAFRHRAVLAPQGGNGS